MPSSQPVGGKILERSSRNQKTTGYEYRRVNPNGLAR
jgi:hypothetical protein